MRSSSTSLVHGATVACACLPINSIGRARDYIGTQWTGTQPTLYKAGSTPSAYPLCTLAQYYGYPGQSGIFAQTAVCTDNFVWLL